MSRRPARPPAPPAATPAAARPVPPAVPGAASAGRVRWTILAMLLVIAMVTYLDRVNISVAGRHIMAAYGLSAVDMGKIFSAFVLGYALLQIPAGLLGDRFGPRRLLTFAIVWWSGFTAVTAWAGDLFTAQALGIVGSFVLVRFLIGAGEAAAYPNFNRVIAFWMAPGERALGNSLVLGASGLGAAITPPAITLIIAGYGWKASFVLCAVVGVVVAAIWFRYATDRPDQHPRVTAAELAVIRGEAAGVPAAGAGAAAGRPLPFRAILRSRNVWMLVLSNFMFGYVAYIYLTWFYLYLVDVRGFSVLASGYYGTLPFIAITIMTPLGGMLSDRLVRRRGRRVGRRAVVVAGLSATAVLVAVGGRVENPMLAIALLSLGAGCLYFSISPYWAAVIDIAQSRTGVVSGMMNTGGHIGGALSPTLTPWLAGLFGWTWALYVAAVVALLGGLIWFFIDADRPVEA